MPGKLNFAVFILQVFCLFVCLFFVVCCCCFFFVFFLGGGGGGVGVGWLGYHSHSDMISRKLKFSRHYSYSE